MTERETPWPDALLTHWGVAGREAPADTGLLARELDLPETIARHLTAVYGPLVERLVRCLPTRRRPMMLGLNGAQGTGKSTAAEVLAHLLDIRGFRVCRLSIDDLYLTRAERQALARRVHPLLATRGVPGTHDLALGQALLERLANAERDTAIAIPRFDKASDDRLPEAAWEQWRGKPHLIILEGWCVGARPQPVSALNAPINRLEREEDADGRWRHYVNERLSDYQALFQPLDYLLMLRAPSFEQVYQWRSEQEAALARRLEREGRSASGLMSDTALRRFIDHYERLTRWILEEMPARADLVFALNAAHRIEAIRAQRGTTL